MLNFYRSVIPCFEDCRKKLVFAFGQGGILFSLAYKVFKDIELTVPKLVATVGFRRVLLFGRPL